MRRSRSRGVTLYELLVALALLAAVAAIAGTTLHAARRDDALAGGLAEDLRHVRTATDAVARELRGAADLVTAEGTLRADGVVWEVREGVLVRDGVPVARGIAELRVERAEEGLLRVVVAPAARRDGTRAPALVTAVRPRREAAR